MNDIKTRKDISLFVHAFYEKVQQDELLAPIFNSKINTEQWPAHLDKMTSFWASVLFHERDYKGNPFQHHTRLGISKSHFDQWIKTAQLAMDRSDSIRNIFQSKLEFLGS